MSFETIKILQCQVVMFARGSIIASVPVNKLTSSQYLVALKTKYSEVPIVNNYQWLMIFKNNHCLRIYKDIITSYSQFQSFALTKHKKIF